MALWRRDPASGNWTSIAPERAARPFASATGEPTCPFCPGQEHETPEALEVALDPSGESWQVRVVPNKFPALEASAPFQPPLDTSVLFAQMPGYGLHEVLIESPRHVLSLTALSLAEVERALGIYVRRMAAARQAPHIQWAVLFKNVGSAAGASLPHTHSQLMGLPMIPPAVERELAAAIAHREQTGNCLWCDVIAAELAAETRIVLADERFVCWMPFASRAPYEMCLAPRAHQADFDARRPEELRKLAAMLLAALTRLERACPGIAYNFFVHTSPFDTPRYDRYHWHIEIVPRMTMLAGFEWASGLAINTVEPEQAAQELRDA